MQLEIKSKQSDFIDHPSPSCNSGRPQNPGLGLGGSRCSGQGGEVMHSSQHRVPGAAGGLSALEGHPVLSKGKEDRDCYTEVISEVTSES